MGTPRRVPLGRSGIAQGRGRRLLFSPRGEIRPSCPARSRTAGGGQGVTAGRRGAQLFLLVFVVPEEALLRARPPGSSRLAGGRHVAAISWPTGCAAGVAGVRPAARVLPAPVEGGCASHGLGAAVLRRPVGQS